MAKIEQNSILKGARGMFGGQVVYRELRGCIIMSNRPRKRAEMTAHQATSKTKFLEAVGYGKKAIADPQIKAFYQPGPDSKFTSAYAAAVAHYLKSGPNAANEIEI